MSAYTASDFSAKIQGSKASQHTIHQWRDYQSSFFWKGQQVASQHQSIHQNMMAEETCGAWEEKEQAYSSCIEERVTNQIPGEQKVDDRLVCKTLSMLIMWNFSIARELATASSKRVTALSERLLNFANNDCQNLKARQNWFCLPRLWCSTFIHNSGQKLLTLRVAPGGLITGRLFLSIFYWG